MSKWNYIKSKTEGMPKFHVNVDGVCCTETVIFATEDHTVHLGYCIKRTELVDSLFGAEVQEIIRWYDQRGDRIEDVNRWAPLPEE